MINALMDTTSAARLHIRASERSQRHSYDLRQHHLQSEVSNFHRYNISSVTRVYAKSRGPAEHVTAFSLSLTSILVPYWTFKGW